MLLLVPTEAGGRGGGTVWPCLLYTTPQWHFASLAAQVSSTNIPDSLFLPLQIVSSQPATVLFLSPLSKPHVPAPRPFHTSERDSGWGMQSRSTDHSCRSYTVLPTTDQFLYFLSVPALPGGEGMANLFNEYSAPVFKMGRVPDIHYSVSVLNIAVLYFTLKNGLWW